MSVYSALYTELHRGIATIVESAFKALTVSWRNSLYLCVLEFWLYRWSLNKVTSHVMPAIRMLNLLCDRSIKLHGLILFDYFFLSLRKWYINTQMKKNNKMNFKKFHDMCSYCGLGNLIVWYICRCICPREYTGRHCEELYVPCQPSPCRNGGTCIPSGGLSYQCICQSGRSSTRKQQSSSLYS